MNVFVLTLCLAFGVCLIGDCNAESEGYSKPDFCTDAIMDQDCRALGIHNVCARGQTYSNLCILCLVCERDRLNVLSYTDGKCN
ncbi:uncharacterized protein LOC117297046 [Asterias rubens]|uniref:uncharacterized protein LOC117297046 n=1 Tax=Asterias rubens TaxID=7604 RepID=UPI000FECCC09|nr:uncharacterized protein LOC117297046 [Asterias rubens]